MTSQYLYWKRLPRLTHCQGEVTQSTLFNTSRWCLCEFNQQSSRLKTQSSNRAANHNWTQLYNNGADSSWVEFQTNRLLEAMEEDCSCDETPSQSSWLSTCRGQGIQQLTQHNPGQSCFLAQVCLHVWHSLSHLAHEESCSWWRRLCSRRRLHQSRSFVGGTRVQCLAGEGETWRIWSVWCGQFLITFLISVTKYQTSIVLFLETVAHTGTQAAIK